MMCANDHDRHPITRWRENQKPRWSMNSLAKSVGIASPSMLAIERGGGMSRPTIEALVRITGLTAGQILGLEPYEPESDATAAEAAA
jgi:transcriptional regulator with XRE-family HTH domain